MTTYILRPARTMDAGKVGAILSGFIDETDWMPRLHSRAEDIRFADIMIANGWVTIAEQDGTVCGFAAREGRMLNALYVARDHRQQGCGTALRLRMPAEISQLELWTFQINTPARAFYKKHGFSEVERTDGASTEEKLPDVKLVWQLESKRR